jgi:predicted NBD/HSP70 family sugar kinase
MTIQENGPLCECGNRGCWEVLASITWLAHQARQALQSGRQSRIPLLDEVKAQAAAIYAAALDNDALALELVNAHGRHFGTGIANLINVLNPKRIILHGESVAGGPPFLQAVRQVVQERTLKRPREMVEIVFSDLGDEVGLIGAASLVMETFFQSTTYSASAIRALSIEETSAASPSST